MTVCGVTGQLHEIAEAAIVSSAFYPLTPTRSLLLHANIREHAFAADSVSAIEARNTQRVILGLVPRNHSSVCSSGRK
jgi:hypothetical protein